MNHFKLALTAAVCGIALAAAGCADDVVDAINSVDTGSGDTSGDTSAAGTCSTTTSTSGTGMCDNECDEALIDGCTSGIVRSCGLGCLGQPDEIACTLQCVAGEPNNIALSQGCGGCYADVLNCTLENCVNKGGICLAADAEDCEGDACACNKCQMDNMCLPNFWSCAGKDEAFFDALPACTN